MALRNEAHYRSLILRNPHATVGLSLAAIAVYAVFYGFCEKAQTNTEEYKNIFQSLQESYNGDNLTSQEVLSEMDAAQSGAQAK